MDSSGRDDRTGRRRHVQPAVDTTAPTRLVRPARPRTLLTALLVGALAAAAITLPATAPTTVPAAWTDGVTLTWDPVAGVRSYVVAADSGGRTSRHVTACCSWTVGPALRTATLFVRPDEPAARWTQAGNRRGRTGQTSALPAPPTVAPPSPTPPAPGSDAPTTSSAGPTTSDAPIGTGGPVPVGPPGPVCDAIPARYPTAPAGAIVVRASVPGDLADKTDATPAGTTFWLEPGTHVLGPGEFDQVIPKDGDTFLGAPGAVLDGKGRNDFAFTQHARNVTISNLTVQGFTAPQDQGVVNHDSANGWTIEYSTIQNNRGAGLMAGANQNVVGNCLRANGQYAMNAYQDGNAITGLVVSGNEVVGNNADDWEAKVPGCGCSGGIKFWAVNGADVVGNWVHDNRGVGLWADTDNNDFLVEKNLVEGNDAEGVVYEASYNVVLRDNTFRRNALVSGKEFADRGDNFPEASVYLSESGGDSRIPARTAKIDIYGNSFVDNWSGITAWENADRFCNSPANTSSGDCTLLVPTVSTCSAPGIAKAPLYDTCRWKTQNVDVHGNTFSFDPAAVGCTTGLCGRMAVLSNFGTYPQWSPYQGDVVENAITFHQGNTWHANTYTGPWTFMPFDTSRTLTAAQWQAAPYGQDACSSFSGGASTC